MRGKWIVVVAAALGLLGEARADQWDKRFGYYGTGTAGVSSPISDGEMETRDAAGVENNFDFELENGLVASGAAGFYTGPARVEFEIGYHSNDVDTLEGDFVPGGQADGDMTALSFTLNGFYDIRVVDPVAIYLGGGVGVAAVEFDASTLSASGTRFEAESDDAAVCGQLMAGLDFKVTKRVHAIVGYRLWIPFGGNVQVTSTTGNTTISTVSDGDELDLPMIHSVELGLRIDL